MGFSTLSLPSGTAVPASEDEAEEERIPHSDPEIEAAIKAEPPISIDRKHLMRSGWVKQPEFASTIIAFWPRVLRAPNAKCPSKTIRTTFAFNGEAWVKIEGDFNLEELDSRAAKVPERVPMTITCFESNPRNPELQEDSDAELEKEPQTNEQRLRDEAHSSEHLMTHRPKNPFCPICQRAKMYAPQALKVGGSSSIESKSYGAHLTVDHLITRDQRVGLVIKDVCAKFQCVYPSPTKEADQVHDDLLHFVGVDDEIGIIYSDHAPELKDAVHRMGIRHNTSREYVDENKAVIEREVRTILEGTRANLVQSGLPDSMWPLAAQHHAMALNTSPRVATGAIPSEGRFGEQFPGMHVPFGARVLFWNPKQNVTGSSKFARTGQEGIFLGYHVQPGFIFKREYLVTPVAGCQDPIENGVCKVVRVRRMELPHGGFTFPTLPQEVSSRDSAGIPSLDDQNCFVQELPEDIFNFDSHLKGSELFDEIRARIDKPKDASDQWEEPPKPEDPMSLPKRNAEGSKKPEPSKPSSTLHDPNTLPTEKPVPPGYNWDGVRPPDTPSEFWHMYSAKQREEDIARYRRKVELEEERLRKEREAEAPAMPVVHGELSQEPRERIALLFWDKLADVAEQQLALIARLVPQSEVERTPDAKAAMDKEWKKLVDKACWLTKKAREYKDVIREHQAKGTKARFGRIFEICSQKETKLPDGDPNKKWKGRSVFQGNRFSDENDHHAIFSELGSSLASMEAGKIEDVFGSQPEYSKQQGDAKQAYTQALFDGIETWVRLPRNRWPKEWAGMSDPVCPLRLALYGHPDSGGLWKRHCQQELEKVGWTAVLPEIRQSVIYHAELDLLLVIYVDNFKMAGPEGNLDKGCETINSLIDMDPAGLFGRYFGCNHHEQRQVMLSRDDHPFAYVFDKKSTAAAGLGAERNRTEDHWEIDPDLGAAIKHHVYPLRLYAPTVEDLKSFPNIGSNRLTVLESIEQIENFIHENVGAKKE